MEAHPLTTYSFDSIYKGLDIEDLLMAATVKGYLSIQGKPPIHYYLSNLFNQNQEVKGGFDNIELVDDVKDKTSLFQIKTSSEQIKHLKAEFIDIKDFFNDRIVIYPVLRLENNNLCCMRGVEYNLEDFQHLHLKTSKLMIMPINLVSSRHFTVFILDHQNKEGYYFDSLGNTHSFFETYCKNIGYGYRYNEKALQRDVVSCGPIDIKFIFHVIDCIRRKQIISAKGMPKFIPGTVPYNDMREYQKGLLSDLYYFPARIKMEADRYMWEHCVTQNVVNSAPLVNSDNLYFCPIMTSLGILIGGGIGIAISRINIFNQPVTTFLSNKLQISIEEVDIIFSISCAIICASVFGIIAYIVGSYTKE